jgi:hypothetical protein
MQPSPSKNRHRRLVPALVILAVTAFTANLAYSQTRRPAPNALPLAEDKFGFQVADDPAATTTRRYQAAPIEQVVAFETELNRQLNLAIRTGAPRTDWSIAETKIYKDVLDRRVWHGLSQAATRPADLDLQELRNLVNRRFDQAIADNLAGRAGLASLGSGTIGNDFFTTRLLPRTVAPPRIETRIQAEPALPPTQF